MRFWCHVDGKLTPVHQEMPERAVLPEGWLWDSINEALTTKEQK